MWALDLYLDARHVWLGVASIRFGLGN